MKRSFEKVFAQCPAGEFLGREAELDALLSFARGETPSNRLVVLAAPRVGASELLRQAYDRLFFSQTSVTPIYFQLKPGDATAQSTARRFLYEFVLQCVAFSRHDAGIISSSPSLTELAELAAPVDGHWIDRLVESAVAGSETTFVRQFLSAPQRAAAGGARPFVMIDDVHLAAHMADGDVFLDELIDIFSRSLCGMALSGQRRFLFARAQGDIIDLESFPTPDAGVFVEKYAARAGVEINDQTRDLIAVLFAGKAGHMAALVDAAATNGDDLLTFDDVERIYTDEIFGGGIGRYFDRVLALANARNDVLRLLAESADDPQGNLPVDYWKKNSGSAEVETLIDTLHNYEIVNANSHAVMVDPADIIVGDYVRARTRLEIDGSSRALAVGEALAYHIKRSPLLMARSYRRAAAIQLKELLASFDGRQVSALLIDYDRFRNELKGAGEEKLRKALKEDNERLRLPHIVFSAHAAAYYPPLRELCDVERAAVGVGFTDGGRRHETAWLAAEVDSKLEATAETAEFWCDRLEMAALQGGFSRFTIWLIASEGFSPEAMQTLRERNAYGTSRRQVELLAELLNTQPPAPGAPETEDEYTFDVSMGPDGEIATARKVEEIGRKHNFPSKVTNQLKTALIEACINAAEHSLSPDGIIHLKFVVHPEKVTVTVTNRGVRLADKKATHKADKENRRGWGLKLIKGLMDEVSFDETDDGTSLTMVKNLPSQA